MPMLYRDGLSLRDETSGCTKSLLKPVCIDEFFVPDKPFQKPMRAIFFQIALRLQSKWLQKSR